MRKRRRNKSRSSKRYTVITKLSAWTFIISLLIIGSQMIISINNIAGYVLIAAGLFFGGFKVLKGHW